MQIFESMSCPKIRISELGYSFVHCSLARKCLDQDTGLSTTIPDKIFGTRYRNPIKSNRTRKL